MLQTESLKHHYTYCHPARTLKSPAAIERCAKVAISKRAPYDAAPRDLNFVPRAPPTRLLLLP